MNFSLLCRSVYLWLMLSASVVSSTAAPPVNDNFANRINLGNTFPTTGTGTNVDATEQSGEPLSLSGLSTVWWRWTAPAAGRVEVDTSGSADAFDEPLDTVLAVYTGTALGNLLWVAGNEESAADSTHPLRFTATAGTTYAIQVLGYEGAEGSLKLNIKTAAPPPSNDIFANAVTLITGEATTGITGEATLQTSEGVVTGIDSSDYRGSAWWAWTAPAAGWYRLSVTGATFRQVASVWTGTDVSALTPVHAITGGSGEHSNLAELFFPAVAGTRYPIAVGNLYTLDGRAVSLTVSAAVPPVYNTSLSVSPSRVNVTSPGTVVLAVFRLVSVQPVTGGLVELTRTDGSSGDIYFFTSASRSSGTSTDGTYSIPLSFTGDHPLGVYRINRIGAFGDGFSAGMGEGASSPFATGTSRSITIANTDTVDTAGPALTSVDVSPNPVNVTSGAQTVTVTMQIMDALSGFKAGSVRLGNGATGFFGQAKRTAGTAQNGTYAISLTVPDYLFGEYVISIDGMEDAVGNTVDTINSTDETFPGPFRGTLRVNRTPIHVVNTFALSPAAVDVTNGAVHVNATCSITTRSGGFDFGYLSFRHPTADSSFGVYLRASDLTSGTATSGIYSVSFPVPRYLAPGVYIPELGLQGTAGEYSQYSANGFSFPPGSAAGVAVTNTGAVDAAPPAVTFISASPRSFSLRSATELNVRVRATDNLSGVAGVHVVLMPAGSNIQYSLAQAVRISGNSLDGVWELRSRLPPGLEAGDYVLRFEATDAVNQFSAFTTNASMAAQFFTITDTLFGYGEWTSNNTMSDADALAAADPDYDGASNILEFALGMAPQTAPARPASLATAGLPAASLQGSGAARRLTLQFWVPYDLQWSNALKLTYLAQFSSDGITWTDVPQANFAIDEDTALHTTIGLSRFCTVSDPATYSASQPRFGRIRVSYNP